MPRRFPPPWIAEETDACFIVRDANGQALAYVYFEEEPGRRAAAKLLTRDEARPIAANIIPKLNALRDKSLDWWVVAADAELVAIQVTEICAIVVRMIVRPETGLTFASCTICDGTGVAPVHRTSVRSEQCHHLSIARCSALTVVRTADKEKRPVPTGLHPTRPWFLRLGKLQREPKLIHHTAVKGECAFKVSDSNMDMRKHLIILGGRPTNIAWTTRTDKQTHFAPR